MRLKFRAESSYQQLVDSDMLCSDFAYCMVYVHTAFVDLRNLLQLTQQQQQLDIILNTA